VPSWRGKDKKKAKYVPKYLKLLNTIEIEDTRNK